LGGTNLKDMVGLPATMDLYDTISSVVLGMLFSYLFFFFLSILQCSLGTQYIGNFEFQSTLAFSPPW